MINPAIDSWVEILVGDTFADFDAEAILGLRVNQDLEDRPTWHYDKKGLFPVKSAYKLTVQQRENKLVKDASGSNEARDHGNSFQWDKNLEFGSSK